MARYELLIKAAAVKEFETLPKKVRQRMLGNLRGLAENPENPRPHGADKLSGEEKYRLRQGDYRALFSIDDNAKTVTIVKMGHRREGYRG